LTQYVHRDLNTEEERAAHILEYEAKVAALERKIGHVRHAGLPGNDRGHAGGVGQGRRHPTVVGAAGVPSQQRHAMTKCRI
jgi:hypothetical protein